MDFLLNYQNLQNINIMFGLIACNYIFGSEWLIQDFEFSIIYNNEDKEKYLIIKIR